MKMNHNQAYKAYRILWTHYLKKEKKKKRKAKEWKKNKGKRKKKGKPVGLARWARQMSPLPVSLWYV